MVAPTATFSVFQGDVGVGPRSSGPQAAIEFAKQISPTSYQFQVGSGPFTMDPCGETSAEIILTGKNPNKAVIATFKYVKGILVGVESSHVYLTRGDFPNPSTH